MHDLIIIGGGPAGMSAGIYASRQKLKTLLLTKTLGGQIAEAVQIDNYLGFDSILGTQLMNKFTSHLKKFDLELKEGERVMAVNQLREETEEFEVITEKNKYQTKTVLITSGESPRKLGVPGEEEFIGKGVVFCATCDAALFRNKIVAVVGAGNAGMDAAIQLTNYVKKIYLLNKYPTLQSGDETYKEKVKNFPLIEIINNVKVKEIKGDKFVKSLIYQDRETQEEKEINLEGVFIEIGSSPNLQFVQHLIEYNNRKEIIIDPETNMTNVKGIFAAGDVTNIPYKQIIIAAGEGAKAALNVYYYLTGIKTKIRSL